MSARRRVHAVDDNVAASETFAGPAHSLRKLYSIYAQMYVYINICGGWVGAGGHGVGSGEGRAWAKFQYYHIYKLGLIESDAENV